MKTAKNRISPHISLAKTPKGIINLDEITGVGLPKGRPKLVAGNAGCGKTLLAMKILIRGVLYYDEPGVFFFDKIPLYQR